MKHGERRPAVITAAVVGVALTLSGCSSGSSARTLPPLSPPSTTPSSSSVQAQVTAAVLTYIGALNLAFTTGDTATLQRLTLVGCFCRHLQRTIEVHWSNGSHMRGARYVVRRLRVHDVHGSTAAVDLVASVTPYVVIDATGHTTDSSSGGQVHVDLFFVREAGTWLLSQSIALS